MSNYLKMKTHISCHFGIKCRISLLNATILYILMGGGRGQEEEDLKQEKQMGFWRTAEL